VVMILCLPICIFNLSIKMKSLNGLLQTLAAMVIAPLQ